MTFDKQSSARRTAVESKSNCSYNRRIRETCWWRRGHLGGVYNYDSTAIRRRSTPIRRPCEVDLQSNRRRRHRLRTTATTKTTTTEEEEEDDDDIRQITGREAEQRLGRLEVERRVASSRRSRPWRHVSSWQHLAADVARHRVERRVFRVVDERVRYLSPISPDTPSLTQGPNYSIRRPCNAGGK